MAAAPAAEPGSADTWTYRGRINGAPAGFTLGHFEPLLPQSRGERVGPVRLIFTEPAAGVGEAIPDRFLRERRPQGHRRFDAHEPPGYRTAKSFVELHRFSARHVVMHRRDG